jgi:hypothetical protein
MASALSANKTPLPTISLFLCAYPLQIRRIYQPVPSNGHLFWFHYSGLSAAVSQYETCRFLTTLFIASFKHSISGFSVFDIFIDSLDGTLYVVLQVFSEYLHEGGNEWSEIVTKEIHTKLWCK